MTEFHIGPMILNDNHQAFVSINGNKVLMRREEVHQYLDDNWDRLAKRTAKGYNNE